MKHTAATAMADGLAPDAFIDVWSRTAPKYRRRAVLLLSVTLLLFAGLCCFTYWLRTGVYGPWSDSESYRELMYKSFNPIGDRQVTLIDFLLFPISVEQVPMQWVIIGLLLASLSSVPILIAILYRFPAALVCCLMVSGLAAMPWLGATVLLGCAVASLKPFRLSFRYASALLGLVPVALYFISATREPAGYFAMTPFRAKLAAPWVLAALGSCVICAVALAIAKLINYRPGGIAPVLALLFALPVLLFHAQVGRDELEYRILENRVGPGSRYVFINRPLAEEARAEAGREWSKEARGSLNAFYAQRLTAKIEEAFDELHENRDAAIERCDAFQSRFGGSRYVPNVLYLKGRALDMRIDRVRLHDNGLLQYYADFPHPASRATWRTLGEGFPASDLSAYGLLQGALLDARSGRLDAAQHSLDVLLSRFGGDRRHMPELEPPATIFGRPPPATSLGFHLESVLTPARRTRELIALTRGDPRHADDPLVALLALNPRAPEYGTNLAALLSTWPDALIQGPVAVRLALRCDNVRDAVAHLQRVSEEFNGSPFQAEPLFFLGSLFEQSGRYEDARSVFGRLIREHASSCYAAEARGRLTAIALLGAASHSSGGNE